MAVILTTDSPADQMMNQAQRIAQRTYSVDIPPDPVLDGARPRGVYSPEQYSIAFPELEGLLDQTHRVVVGHFDALDFRTDRKWDSEKLSGNVEPDTNALEFVLALPDPDLFPAPHPIVIAQHGFNDTNRFALKAAREYNAHGFAVIGIDAVSHGTRGAAYSLFNVQDIRVGRDNLRQSVADLFQLQRMVQVAEIDVDGRPGPDLGEPVGYFGHSMGGILGTIFCATAPLAPVTVLNAPGGMLTEILEAENIAGGIGILLRAFLGLDYSDPALDEVMPFFKVVAQMLFEPADPLSYAHLVHQERPDHVQGTPRLLIQEDLGDLLMPNAATRDLMDTIGLSEIEMPAVEESGISGLWLLDPADYPEFPPDENPHGLYFLAEGPRIQAGNYMKSGGTEVTLPLSP
jgi:pimeloyl-ACP methyl ester carboxylesterase